MKLDFSFGLLLFAMANISGCSQVSTRTFTEVPYQTDQDFSDHWEVLGADFREGQIGKGVVVALSQSSRQYLAGLVQKIQSGGQPLFDGFDGGEVFIIDDIRPFHFSVPSGKIFISLGLLKKYIRYEGLLASILVIEIIRSHRKIYIKNTMVPTGIVSFERLTPLLKISTEMKNEVNKWTVYTLKKVGFDPLALLRLLQIKSRNVLDFHGTQSENINISVEKVKLKDFLVRHRLFSDSGDNSEVLQNSSEGFFNFMNEIKET